MRRVLAFLVGALLCVVGVLRAQSVEEVRAQLLAGGRWRTQVTSAQSALPDSVVWQFTRTYINSTLTRYRQTSTGEIRVARTFAKRIPYILRRGTDLDRDLYGWAAVVLCIHAANTPRATCRPLELTGSRLAFGNLWYFTADGAS